MPMQDEGGEDSGEASLLGFVPVLLDLEDNFEQLHLEDDVACSTRKRRRMSSSDNDAASLTTIISQLMSENCKSKKLVDQLTAKIDRLKETNFLIQREQAAFKAQHVSFSKSAEGMQELLRFAAINLLAPGLGVTLLQEYAGPQAANIQAFDVENLAHFSPSAYVLDRCTRLSGNWDLSFAGAATDLSEFAYFMKTLFEGVQRQLNSPLQTTSPVVDHHVFQHSVYSMVCSMMDMFCPSSKVFISPFAVLTQMIIKSVTQSSSEAVNVVGRSLPGGLHSQAMSKNFFPPSILSPKQQDAQAKKRKQQEEQASRNQSQQESIFNEMTNDESDIDNSDIDESDDEDEWDEAGGGDSGGYDGTMEIPSYEAEDDVL